MAENRFNPALQKIFDESLGHNASRLGHLMRQETQKCIAAAGYKITPEQWQALVYLDGAGERGLTQTELSNLTLKDKTSVSRLVKGMFDAGLITVGRGEGEDRRTNRLRASLESRAMVSAIWPHIISHYSHKVFGGLSQAEQAELLRLMLKVRSTLGDIQP